MCGFVGAVFRHPITPDEGRKVAEAAESLVHRGPDDSACEVISQANAVLAFRRLSIIDLASGDQPMQTGSGQHLVFNGEIYNFRAVRAQLESKGERFRTQSDTEVLLKQLSRDGTSGLHPLKGMWGFAFVDAQTHTLLLGRDRLGIKPLYYAETEEGLSFASEPKALLALPWVKARLATERLRSFFSFRCVPHPFTLFEGINKLGPGTTLTLDLTSWERRIERYWAPPTPGAIQNIGLRDAVDRFEEVFLEAIRRRLVSDVPVGAFLSGGLDSSLIVAGMARLGHSDLRTFSATFPGYADDESTFARRVSDRFQTRRAEYEAHPAEFAAALPEWVNLNDDLVADASALPLLAVSRLAQADRCKVLLSGEGSDELFGGYGSYHKFILLNRLHRLLPSRSVQESILQLLLRSRLVKGQDQPRVEEYLVRGAPFMGTAALLGDPELDALLAGERVEAEPIPRRATGSSMSELCAFDFEARIPEDLLMRTDRATMGASIEARVPFLDHDVVEFVFALPARLRSVPGVSKIIPRILARRWKVPYQTIVHRKIGFHLPIGEWFRGPLAPFWDRVLSERRIDALDYDFVSSLVMAHRAYRGHFEELLWRVAALELWYRRWIEGGAIAELVIPSAAHG